MHKFITLLAYTFQLFCLMLFALTEAQAQNSGAAINKTRTIVIDPGHGGKDSGALGKHSMEKDIVLDVSLILGKYLEERLENCSVIYTRQTDVFIPLHERARIANENDAELFVSIHVNASTSKTPYGTSSHVLGLHRTGENFEVAKRENGVILMEEDYSTRYEGFDPNSPESYIIFSLMQNIYLEQSIYFAQLVQDQFRDRVKRKDRGVKQQGLLVLAQTSMPGVLIETGFISNATEEKYLNTEKGKDYIASAIFRAIRDYFEFIDSQTQVPLAIRNKEPELSDSQIQTQAVTAPTQMELTDEENIRFKVQVISSKKQIHNNDSIFKDLTDIEEFQHKGMYKYAVGSKTDYAEIVDFSKWVKNRFPDAFVIAVENNKIISVKEALQKLNSQKQ